ncbi:hypothetical protein L2E82_29417 [Cichorium intybus]|uniref:Uncharacterized protein n=1 Tax=Cichorium intybus TaxID=13427 RepID=A0ACB9CXS3_CICIN|nr:hypothetical protein L2E82_29417 [Cichorium intybus]
MAATLLSISEVMKHRSFLAGAWGLPAIFTHVRGYGIPGFRGLYLLVGVLYCGAKLNLNGSGGIILPPKLASFGGDIKNFSTNQKQRFQVANSRWLQGKLMGMNRQTRSGGEDLHLKNLMNNRTSLEAKEWNPLCGLELL